MPFGTRIFTPVAVRWFIDGIQLLVEGRATNHLDEIMCVFFNYPLCVVK